MTTSLKAGFAQIFSCCPKNLSCPKLGGGVLQAPSPPPPRPYAYVLNALTFQVSMHVQKTINDYVSRHQNYKFCLHSCKIPVPLRKKKNNYSKHQRTNFVPISAHSLISAPHLGWVFINKRSHSNKHPYCISTLIPSAPIPISAAIQ